MNAEMRYRCPGCRELHKTPAAAKTCCEPLAREVWVCGNCEQEHVNGISAAYCCTADQELAA